MSDKHSRSVFVKCDCGTRLIEIVRPHNGNVYLKFWYTGRYRMSFIERLKAAWRALCGKSLFLEGIALTEDSAEELAQGLDELLGGAANPPYSFLTSLRRTVNEIIVTARGRVDDAVNWGNLSCLDAKISIDEHGAIGYIVYISEAAPDAYKFQEYVRQELADRGYVNVEVVTSW